jgi:hypothetical protein
VDKQGKVIIITDDSTSTQQTAEGISALMGGSGYQTAVVKAEDFTGIELLPTCAFFLGCESPKPSSFVYIEDMLEHINLAGRPCGIFSSDSSALKYLSTLVQASEAAVGEPFLTENGLIKRGELHNWIQGVVGG